MIALDPENLQVLCKACNLGKLAWDETDLEQLIDLARKYREDNSFTQEERDRQVRSFAFGNTHFENEEITMGDIDTAMDTLRTEVEHEPTLRT